MGEKICNVALVIWFTITESMRVLPLVYFKYEIKEVSKLLNKALI